MQVQARMGPVQERVTRGICSSHWFDSYLTLRSSWSLVPSVPLATHPTSASSVLGRRRGTAESSRESRTETKFQPRATRVRNSSGMAYIVTQVMLMDHVIVSLSSHPQVGGVSQIHCFAPDRLVLSESFLLLLPYIMIAGGGSLGSWVSFHLAPIHVIATTFLRECCTLNCLWPPWFTVKHPSLEFRSSLSVS